MWLDRPVYHKKRFKPCMRKFAQKQKKILGTVCVKQHETWIFSSQKIAQLFQSQWSQDYTLPDDRSD